MNRAEEQRLIELAAAGDRSAAERCIRAHQSSLYAYLLRMCGRPELAEDIVQEAFVRVLTNLDRYDPRFRFSTWLFTIARRLYINACQKHQPAYDSEAMDGWRSTGRDPEEPAVADEVRGNLRDALQAALLHLPPDMREVVILFHQLDWPIALIAQHMDKPEGTIKSHLHRARQRMRRLIEAHEKHAQSVAELWGTGNGEVGT
jgi:RNA polymerase sigma-70 factor, ECF subfamily